MKITYEFVTGEVSGVEVDEHLGGMLLDLDRQQDNNDQKEPRRHVSLDSMDYEGELFASAEDTEGEAVRREDMARLYSAMEALSPSQRELVEKVYFEGRKITDIAREEGVTKQSVHERVERALKKLKKNFD
ncbi:MAG: sigma-70 family RNA polymerase sigma factor [Lachnospiraceae bacterium]